MAKPDIENGYTKIADELLEAICRTKTSDYEKRVFLYIIRKTYGFNKKKDWIAQVQISNGTGIHRSHVSRTIKKLEAKNMIILHGKEVGIQKDYEQWNVTNSGNNGVTQTGNNKVTQTGIDVTQTGNEKLPKQDTKVTQTGTHNRHSTTDTSTTNNKQKRDISFGKEPEDSSSSQKTKHEYTDEFEEAWQYMRKRNKKKAFKAWNARIKEGIDPQLLIRCSKNYKQHLDNEETPDTYRKHGSTFFGPDHDFEDWEKPQKTTDQGNARIEWLKKQSAQYLKGGSK